MKKGIALSILILTCSIVFGQSGDGVVWDWLDKLLILKVGLPLAALVSYYQGYRQSKSGSLEGLASLGSKENVPFWKCGGTVFGYIFTAGTIGFYIWQYFEK